MKKIILVWISLLLISASLIILVYGSFKYLSKENLNTKDFDVDFKNDMSNFSFEKEDTIYHFHVSKFDVIEYKNVDSLEIHIVVDCN
jgi:hypothetical protein